MKSLQFIYEQTEINFLLNPGDKNIMINATEMAKIFGKRTDKFLENSSTKAFIKLLKLPRIGGSLEPLPKDKIIQMKGRNGIYFHRALALKFAAWLDLKFEIWVFTKIEELVFGNYKKHWDAHAMQEEALGKMQSLKIDLLNIPTAENVKAYFQAEKDYKYAKNLKTKALRNQLKLFK